MEGVIGNAPVFKTKRGRKSKRNDKFFNKLNDYKESLRCNTYG